MLFNKSKAHFHDFPYKWTYLSSRSFSCASCRCSSPMHLAYNSGVHLRVIGFGYSSRKIRGEWYFFSYFVIWLSVKLIRSSPPSPHIRNGPAKKSVGPYKRFGGITSLLPRRNAQLHKQKKQRVIRKRITLCFLVKPFLHKFGVNVVSNHPNAVDKRRRINAF